MNSGMNVVGPSRDNYETPPWLFKALDAEFGFTFDAAADQGNHLCDRWTNDVEAVSFGPEERVFCNPPYSNIAPFVKKALASRALWVLLLPVRVDTGGKSEYWFRRLWESKRATVRPFTKRIRFYMNGAESGDSPRFASMVVVVRPE